MKPSTFLAAAVVLALVVSGCLSVSGGKNDPRRLGGTKGGEAGPLGYLHYESDFFPIETNHDHNDPTLHVDAFQVGFVGHHACTADGKYKAGTGGPSGFTDIAFHENHAYVGNNQGFCILDVSDPANPVFLSQYQGEHSADLEISADGNYVFLLTQRTLAPRNPSSGDPTDHFPRGVIVVNARDKKNPQFESYYPVPTNGVHTAVSFTMGTRQLLSIQTYDWFPPASAGGVPQQNLPVTQRVEITEFKANAAGRMGFERLSLYSYPRPQTTPLTQYFPHDAYVEKHPLDGKTYLYVAYWDAGLVILDISNPSAPSLVSQYNQLAPSKYNAYHDVKVSDQLIDGRHITVTGPELQSAAGEVGYFRIFDTSNPAKPEQIGAWTLPGVDGFSGGFLFSPHVFQVIGGRIYLAHNHGGIWVVDIHNETLLREPKAAGYYFPHGSEHDTGSWARSASVWGAYVHKGHIYATEGTQGVHVLKWAAPTASP